MSVNQGDLQKHMDTVSVVLTAAWLFAFVVLKPILLAVLSSSYLLFRAAAIKFFDNQVFNRVF